MEWARAQWDRFDNCTVIMADSIEKAEKKERMDTYPEKRVELHAHTKMSAVDEIERCQAHGEDRGKMGGGEPLPSPTMEWCRRSRRRRMRGKDIKILYGCEGYLLEDRDGHRRGRDHQLQRTSHQPCHRFCQEQGWAEKPVPAGFHVTSQLFL